MRERLGELMQKDAVKFVGRTIFYFLILAALVYLYSYSGIDQPHFIYNEFQLGDILMNIIKKIDNWGTTSPNKIAYDYLGTTNTYADLKNYSDKLATYLNQLNLDTKNPIMVFGGQDFNMIATFLGIVKAGYAYIPVDTHSPVER